mmetsp:Transcript_1266/g.3218  ORF Transcript_1266/g.3218 Transcript_1266/m.3218 type:complete len:138 (-) Transcript_1266:45-458(-)|eukprot:CAMPEP_0197425326 /NCGR_PEP_ID=MMETSP1170-20131217/30181_1 /TAXON_ID=54406 /ORGANISM="Sarcinochrysis sp, Strain CCMP770" /LENGTH=137 /DNA_ID=CAMNT_0042952871 /DNA_START=102 /DNA_END=515 /DNA_ORIENTATION=+
MSVVCCDLAPAMDSSPCWKLSTERTWSRSLVLFPSTSSKAQYRGAASSALLTLFHDDRKGDRDGATSLEALVDELRRSSSRPSPPRRPRPSVDTDDEWGWFISADLPDQRRPGLDFSDLPDSARRRTVDLDDEADME